jgi:ribosomal protein S16
VVIDDLGYYNPMTDPPQVQLNEEKALSWLKEGAIPTNTVKSLFSKAGLIQKFRGHEQPIEESEEQPVEEAKPAVEEDKEEEPEAAEQTDSEPADESDEEPADE